MKTPIKLPTAAPTRKGRRRIRLLVPFICPHRHPRRPHRTPAASLLDYEESLRRRPHVFQSVELPLGAAEDVDDHIAVIKQEPARLGRTLDPARIDVDLVGRLLHLPTDRPQQALIVAGADDEEIGDDGQFMDVEYNDILSLRLGSRLGENPCKRRRFDD